MGIFTACLGKAAFFKAANEGGTTSGGDEAILRGRVTRTCRVSVCAAAGVPVGEAAFSLLGEEMASDGSVVTGCVTRAVGPSTNSELRAVAGLIIDESVAVMSTALATLLLGMLLTWIFLVLWLLLLMLLMILLVISNMMLLCSGLILLVELLL